MLPFTVYLGINDRSRQITLFCTGLFYFKKRLNTDISNIIRYQEWLITLHKKYL